MSADLSVGFDLGGTNLRAAVFRGLRSGQPGATKALVEKREAIGRDRSPAQIAARVAALVPELLRRAEVGALHLPVGIGFAGMLAGNAGMVANAPNFGWRNVPLGQMLQTQLGERYKVSVYNDVNAIAYGEYALGAGRGHEDMLAIFGGTGIGAGAVCGGKLLEGSNNAAAELGHTKLVFDQSARACNCGLRGCVEAYVGGWALQERARAELSHKRARSIAIELAGSAAQINPGHLDAAAERGDDYALNLYAEVAPIFGVAIANAVTLLNPQCLVLGGGMLSRTPALKAHVLAAFEVAVNPPARVGLAIEDATLGDDAGLIGSALLASNRD